MNQSTEEPDNATLARHLEALACDCDSTDGWEEAAPDLRLAASRLTLTEAPEPLVERGGYKAAFYEIADMLDIPARPLSPAVVFETEMKPRLRAALSSITTTEAECESCGGLNLACPYGCQRDPATGELIATTTEDSGEVVQDGRYQIASILEGWTEDEALTLPQNRLLCADVILAALRDHRSASQPSVPEDRDAAIERLARAIDPGVWKLVDNPNWFMADNPSDVAMRDSSLAAAARAYAASQPSVEREKVVRRVAMAICCHGKPCLTADGVCVMDPMHLDLARTALATPVEES